MGKVIFMHLVYLLGLVVLSQSSCLLCQNLQCQPLPFTLAGFINLNLTCESTDLDALQNFIDSNDFTRIQNLTLKSIVTPHLNLKKFSSIKNLDLSGNNISSFEVSGDFQTTSLNLSNNSLIKLNGVFPNLVEIDLSYNSLKNLSFLNVTSTKLLRAQLQNNKIRSINNLTSNSLKYLNLKNNEISELSLNKFPSLKELDVSSNLVRDLSNKLPTSIMNIEIINLSSNLLQKLQDYRLNLTNLLKLDLSNNRIQELSQNCFFGLSRLQYLDISLNKIHFVAPSTFQYLNGLINLRISNNNEMNSQDFGLLLASRRLKSVHASGTNQKMIPSSLTRSVRYLVLDRNKISQIQCGDLDSYPLLNSLDLTSNNLSYIEDDALGRLDFLVTLNLENNFLLTVPHMLPNSLKNLYLTNNLIKIINFNDFTELQQLLQLDLSFNKIEEIKEESFLQLVNLQKLNLSGNPITIFPTGFNALRKLKILDLSYTKKFKKCEQTISFPVPELNNIQVLSLKNSSNLAEMFMKDVAALKTFKQLSYLNLAESNLSSIRKDFPTYFPRLSELILEGNRINCSEVKSIFNWSLIQEVKQCVFTIKEEHSHMDQVRATVTLKQEIITTIPVMAFNTTASYPKESINISNEFLMYENKTNIDIFDSDYLSNEMWINNENLGVKDAFSAENEPTSHPGLLILLVLPIALMATCLFINYSRVKKTRHQLINSEMDIEISNISSELW